MSEFTINTSLVSVVIPCYNHGRYLGKAIASVLGQSYGPVEVIVVDDGSSDNTREVAQSFGDRVRYVYKQNGGLSAARNTGIEHARGEYLVFLDADDWLYPAALETNLHHLQQNPCAAFVSGSHIRVYVEKDLIKPEKQHLKYDHYTSLLLYNYIGVPASVLYHRWVFDEFVFDETLKSCEDYDLYLKVARKYPVVHHTVKIAAYNIHRSNMSANYKMMLKAVLQVLNRQEAVLRNQKEIEAFKLGKQKWISLYTDFYVYNVLQPISIKKINRTFLYFFQVNYTFFSDYFRKSLNRKMKSSLKKIIPNQFKRKIKHFLFEPHNVKKEKMVSLGDLDRVQPFSTCFGYDRGGPIDRYYIDGFLKQEQGYIQGNVLEIGDNFYTIQYGGEKVTKSDVLHVDPTSKEATIIGDISHAPHIPDNTFDCIILTQTLHLIYNYKDALQTCLRILKPKGTLLMTVPGLSPIDHDEWGDVWYWSFTDRSMNKVMKEVFQDGEVEVKSFGNVFIASAFLYGLGMNDVDKKKFDHNDPHFQVVITIKANKPSI